MANCAYYWSPVSLEHDTGPHVERIERAEVLSPTSIGPLIPKLDARLPKPQKTVEAILRVHSRQYHDFVKDSCASGRHLLDQGDTVVCQHSYDAATVAVDCLLTAADEVASEAVDSAFCAVRPPGHHALPDRAMGFCLFGNIAICARHLQAQHGVGRIAIVDWDVHHGNGTQDIFYEDPSVLFISLHQHPLWPGSGMMNEAGAGLGEGNTLNVPLPPGTSEEDYLKQFDTIVIPKLRQFAPEFLLISAGFDAHKADPLGGLCLTEDGFAQLTHRLRDIADEHCDGRIISTLEGGYNLAALQKSVVAHVTALMED